MSQCNWRNGMLMALLIVALSGCGSTVMPPTSHDPTSPDQVKIYQKAPNKYEGLGTVTVPIGADVRWDEKGDADAGFQKLRAAAAERGANGLLLTAPDGATNAVVTAGYKGTYYQVPVQMNPKGAVAQAIWVVKE